MGQLLTTNFKDVNGVGAKTQFWCNDVLTAEQACQALANLSNAQIVSAYMTRELDISAIPSNNAVNANVETVGEKAKVRLSAPDPGSAGAPRQSTSIGIPAPVGTFINAPGAAQGNQGAAFIGLIVTNSGLVTDRIDRIYYSRSK